MSKEIILEQYRQDVKIWKKKFQTLGLSTEEVNQIVQQSFNELRKENCSKLTKNVTKAQVVCRSITLLFLIFTLLFFILYVVLYVHLPTSSIILRNVQGLTYPTLKFIRLLFVPILKVFPSLTGKFNVTKSCDNC